MPELPRSISPMLAEIGRAPFDSDGHVFEVKWDGIRALAFIEDGGVRLASRRGNALTDRYPEHAELSSLGNGTVLDGELVVLVDGRASFPAVLSRDRARGVSVAEVARKNPSVFVVFDLLYLRFESIMSEPLATRREKLTSILESRRLAHTAPSMGVVGPGIAFFEEVTSRGHEGVVAKRLASPYRPGRRGDDWLKIKKARVVLCAVIGYVPAGEDDLKSLIVATDVEGELRAAGKVGSGLDAATRASLLERLKPLRRATPIVPTDETGVFVEPAVFCAVGYMEMTEQGQLRAPVFRGLVPD